MRDHAYAIAWKRYRRLRFRLWMAFAAFGLGGILAMFVRSRPRFGWMIYAPFASWIYLAFAINSFKRFACPRCGKDFEASWPSKKYPVPGTCSHCGLEKFSKE
jgi:hypothetical protein